MIEIAEGKCRKRFNLYFLENCNVNLLVRRGHKEIGHHPQSSKKVSKSTLITQIAQTR